MLSIFGRQRQAQPAAGDTAQEEPLRSHVLPRFVKRIRAAERPTVLDLGRLSGGNIEFFGQVGCRLQIEDLLACLDETPARPTPEPNADRSASGDAGTESMPPTRPVPAVLPLIREAASPPPRPGETPAAAGPRQGGSPARPGRRPRRHIVLPPRTFHRASDPASAARGMAAASSASAWKSPLPTRFSFADESFDAIVAWDVIDFYDPESARLIAAEARRILKPGGLLLSFFHARRATEPVRPRRYRIVDEGHFCRETTAFEPMPRQVYQNRDIEKMFTGLRIIEQYYLKTGLREILMEKRSAPPEASRPTRVTSRPKPRFRIE
jgi:SAM-dependent methyltransferase